MIPSEKLLAAYELKYEVLRKLAKQQTSFITFNILNNGANALKETINELKSTL